jgi:hypothetical protein
MATIASVQPKKLPRRDLIILPLIAFSTIVFLLLASEVTARFFFAKDNADQCVVPDSRIGFRYRPNCTTRLKAAEGPWVENHYNDCGYRSAASCGARPPGTLRVALIGSSIAEGFFVSTDQALAARAEKALTERCGRPVQVQNLGREQCFPVCTFRRMDEALALKPDLVLFAFSPFDLENLLSVDVANRMSPNLQNRTVANTKVSALRRVQQLFSKSSALTAVEHFLFQDPDTYLRIALNNHDTAEFMRPDMSPVWDQRLANLDLLVGEMAQKADAAHVPLALMEIPSLAQASVLAVKQPPPGVDVYGLNRRLTAIAAKHNIRFVNVMDSFQRTPGSNRMFYVVDGHLNGAGQALLVEPLVDQLTEGAGAPLAECRTTGQSSAGVSSKLSSGTRGY